MSDPAPAPRSARLEDALRALLDDAATFGVLGFGAESPLPAATAAVPATVPHAVPGAVPPSTDAQRTPQKGVGEPVRAAPRTDATRTAAESREAQPPGSDDPAAGLLLLADEIESCRRCPLGGLRAHAVPGQGNPRAEIFFVGEAPGAEEDLSGLAFVGEAGRLLTKMIEATGHTSEDVFVADVLKCRPPGAREPGPDEIDGCREHLFRQIALVRPRVICALGGHAAAALLETDEPIGRLRGVEHRFRGTPVVVTFHPAHLLRTPSEKSKAWEDLKFMLKLLGNEPPARPTTSAQGPAA